ncbi:MAG: hypothetical protein CL678_00560 [Bdellovibrionaceae bacterium]|nr:hypothetical protein [Pseudobdellovibrionaceae bacterium]
MLTIQHVPFDVVRGSSAHGDDRAAVVVPTMVHNDALRRRAARNVVDGAADQRPVTSDNCNNGGKVKPGAEQNDAQQSALPFGNFYGALGQEFYGAQLPQERGGL